jgi:glyoxylase-like metal-dependent hydrolase (beta-lactamase superfamily II)
MTIPAIHSHVLSTILRGNVTRRGVVRGAAAGGLAVAAGGLHPGMRALAGQATPAPEPSYGYTLGTFDLRVIRDGWIGFPAPIFAINAPPEALSEAVAEAGQTMDLFALDLQVLLIDTGDHLVLIDPGAGLPTPAIGPVLAAMSVEGFAGETGHLIPALQAEGIAPEDIDVVIFTHLHVDHISGAADTTGQPAFPNARYVTSQAEYDYWSAGPDLAEVYGSDVFKMFFRNSALGIIETLGDRLERVEPNTEIVPGITVIPASGHTPGHMAVEISSVGQTLLHVGDAAADPVLHLQHPEWFISFVSWPAKESLTRRQLFDRAADQNLLVQTVHFPYPGVGRVTRDGDGWLWQPEV